MEFNLTTLLSNGLIADMVAQFLTPDDLNQVRAVNKAWNEAFQKHFHRRVPVKLEDLDLKLYTTNHSPGSITNQWIPNERFNIKIELSTSKREAALIKLTQTFSTQMKGLQLCLEEGEYDYPPDINVLNAVLEPIRNTLEDLTLIMEIPKEKRRPKEIKRTLMQKLRRLAFVPDAFRHLDGSYMSYFDRQGNVLPPLTPTSCPNLEHIKIVGYPSLQTLFITSPELVRLSSLELFGCSESVLESLCTTAFHTAVKRLKLHPVFKSSEEEHRFPDLISQILLKMALSLELFEIKYKAILTKRYRRDVAGIPVLKPLVLPRMPNLRSLGLNVFVDRRSYASSCHSWKKLRVQFSDSASTQTLRETLPTLEYLTLESTVKKSTFADTFLSEEQSQNPHRNVKLFDFSCHGTDYEEVIIRRNARKAFPYSRSIVYCEPLRQVDNVEFL